MSLFYWWFRIIWNNLGYKNWFVIIFEAPLRTSIFLISSGLFKKNILMYLIICFSNDMLTTFPVCFFFTVLCVGERTDEQYMLWHEVKRGNYLKKLRSFVVCWNLPKSRDFPQQWQAGNSLLKLANQISNWQTKNHYIILPELLKSWQEIKKKNKYYKRVRNPTYQMKIIS